MTKLKKGKIVGLDSITCQHLLFSHMLYHSAFYTKLFGITIRVGSVPLTAFASFILCQY